MNLNERGEMNITRVVIAEDHPMMRKGIRNLLKHASDIEIVGEAGDGATALKLVRDLEPDVLLLDIEMPELKGVEVTRRLKEAGSPVRILVLSAYNDPEFIIGTLAYGASGYMTKDEAPESVIEAVRSVARNNEIWISEDLEALIGVREV
jgi:DNA-binding NarL/FixJ family response regulator